MKGRRDVLFPLEELHEFAMCNKFNRLFIEWEKSGHKKEYKPSIDRINSKKGYSIDNIHWLTWGENRYKQTMERRSRKGPVIQSIGGIKVKEFRSQREAVIETGISQGCISMALNGKRKTAGGYMWRYLNSELLEA
jgi:hypothetical protein